MRPNPAPQSSHHGTGLLVVLTVIAVLGGAAFLGGALALVDRAVGVVAQGRQGGAAGAAGLMSADELVGALREDHGIGSRLDTTAELCAEPEGADEPDPFLCTSAMDTDVVRIVAFGDTGIAAEAARAMREARSDGGHDARDTRDACHFVLVWFDHHGLDRDERDAMADDARSAAGC
ncbi:hypothetical protein [Nocardiopsis sp. NRRL B-16309]|uniref:hypothetical protein n=1 Tax=Nocardiopsis sp. NRRL B-16309 TaxID=1519494 RepID=UPI0006AD9B01|nr:hypothetical protein [Nocardiopsis sp. NRRL B-16309]KOX12107.1 hypothetical protein ADL05_22245 [Nocardiopsis sp. NRRL B-16309]